MTGTRRPIVAAGRHLARAEHVVGAVLALRAEELPTLLHLLDPHADPAWATALLLWDGTSAVSVRHHLDAMRAAVADLPVLAGSRVPHLLADVSDLLDELAGRRTGPVDVADLGAARWRLDEVRRTTLTPAALRVADLPEGRWAT